MSRISPDEVILGLLAGSVNHGYQLLEYFREGAPLGQIWSLSTSQLYSILKRLEHREEIDGREFFPEGAPPRTEYWLTPSGQQHFNLWLHDPFPSASTRHIRTEFLSRLFLARRLNIPVKPLIESQRTAVLARRQQLIAQHDQTPSGVPYLARDLVIRELGVILEWLDQCEVDLSAGTGSLPTPPE
ncbi:MAG: PadR family transcriptional regulator [Anaerolineae bacterium]|nr:PadR family transcriptional regulator [Anaerolineae bacterium]